MGIALSKIVLKSFDHKSDNYLLSLKSYCW